MTDQPHPSTLEVTTMEDSSWEGWTTPPAPPGLDGFPFGRKLPAGPSGGWVGEIRSLPKATDDSVK